MDGSAASGLAAFGMFGMIFTLFLAILWILVPFAIFGIKPILRDLLKEQRRSNELLSALRDAPK
jgi:hypothetical protein